jgi:hypothetical protein
MGVDAGDYDGSGKPALWVTNYENELHGLYRNECRPGMRSFTFQTTASGLARMDQKYVGWGTGFLDADLDGWEDLFVANGHAVRYHYAQGSGRKQPPVLYRNVRGKFTEISRQLGSYHEALHLARGVGFGDLDNDGRIDLLLVAENVPLALLRNRSESRDHFLMLGLEGTASNRDAVGARVTVTAAGRAQVAERFGGGSYLSASDARLHFGLGTASVVDRVEVRWPSGRRDDYRRLPADTGYRLDEGDPTPRPMASFPSPTLKR